MRITANAMVQSHITYPSTLDWQTQVRWDPAKRYFHRVLKWYVEKVMRLCHVKQTLEVLFLYVCHRWLRTETTLELLKTKRKSFCEMWFACCVSFSTLILKTLNTLTCNDRYSSLLPSSLLRLLFQDNSAIICVIFGKFGAFRGFRVCVCLYVRVQALSVFVFELCSLYARFNVVWWYAPFGTWYLCC